MVRKEVSLNKQSFLIIFLLLSFLVLIVACTKAPTPIEEPSEAESLIIEKCSVCHSADRVFREFYTPDEWAAVFNEMIEKGAQVSPDEQSLMIDWLVARK